MASIQKISLKNGKVSYRVFIRLGNKKPITKTFKSKKSAIEFARRIEGDNDLSAALGDPVTHKLILSALIYEYLGRFSGKDKNVFYRLAWWSESIGTIPIPEISHTTIRVCLNQLACSGRRGSTLNRYKANLSSVFEFARESYGISANPCREIKAKPERAGRVRFLDDLERRALLEACKKSEWDRLYLIVLLAITTGARRGELLKLRWRDIDMKSRHASIYDTKNGSNRVLPLTSESLEELKKFQGIGSALLFPSRINQKVAYDFRTPWNKAIRTSKIKNFNFHDLRHTCASYLAQNGCTLIQIADVLGHSSISVTHKYSHLCIKHKQSLINAVMSKIGV
jgi:integrase